MPPFLVGFGGLSVPPLVVPDDLAGVTQLGDAPPPAEHRPAPLVQRPAHLLGRHLGVFPPATAPCGWRRIPGQPGPASRVATTPCSLAPRSASVRPPVGRTGTSAPPPNGGRRRPAVGSTPRPSRWSGSTSPPRWPRRWPPPGGAPDRRPTPPPLSPARTRPAPFGGPTGAAARRSILGPRLRQVQVGIQQGLEGALRHPRVGGHDPVVDLADAPEVLPLHPRRVAAPLAATRLVHHPDRPERVGRQPSEYPGQV